MRGIHIPVAAREIKGEAELREMMKKPESQRLLSCFTVFLSEESGRGTFFEKSAIEFIQKNRSAAYLSVSAEDVGPLSEKGVKRQ